MYLLQKKKYGYYDLPQPYPTVYVIHLIHLFNTSIHELCDDSLFRQDHALVQDKSENLKK